MRGLLGFALLFSSLLPAAQCAETNSPVVVRGRLLSIQLESNEAWRAKFQATFELQFVNVSDHTIIVMRRDPLLVSYSSQEWSREGELTLSASETLLPQPRSRLDKAGPPDDLTATLKPGAVYLTTATIPLEFLRSTRTEKQETPFYPESGRARLELEVRAGLDAFDDLRNEDDSLGSDEIAALLKNRWAGVGELYLGEIDSEPVDIPLPAAPAAPEESGLVLRGRVSSVQMDSETDSDVRVALGLDLEFVNEGKRPVLLLRPEASQEHVGGSGYWACPVVASETPQLLGNRQYISVNAACPSISRNPQWERLQAALDQPRPPSDLVWVIKPGEPRSYQTEAYLSFPKKHGGGPLTPGQEETLWDQVPKGSPLWLQVELGIWDFNIEPKPGTGSDNPEFGRMLRERWAPVGWLELGEASRLTSEPLKFVLPRASD